MAAIAKTESDGRVWVKINHKGLRTKRFIGRGDAAEKEAATLAAELNRDMKREGFVVKKRAEIQTLSQVAMSLFQTPKHRSDNTMTSYNSIFKNQIKDALGAKAVSSITASDIETILEHWRLAGHTPGVIKLYLAVLSLLLNTAVRGKLIAANPVQDLEPGHRKALRGRTRTKVTKALNAEQLVLVLAALRLYNPAQGWSALFLLLARTGLRIGEALTLKWSDIDFQRRQVTVERTARRSQTNKAGEHVAPGKTKTGLSRKVDLSNDAMVVLQALADANPDSAADAWVFPATGRSEQFHQCYKAVAGQLTKATKSLKVGLKITAHVFRHAYASQMLQAGVPVTYISQQLGHASVSMTLDIYSHFLPSAGEHPVNVLDQLSQHAAAAASGDNTHPIRTQRGKSKTIKLVK